MEVILEVAEAIEGLIIQGASLVHQNAVNPS
jgi:hypothetical protein